MTSEQIPPARPYFAASDIEEIKDYAGKILASGQLTLGKYTETFEHQFAEIVGVRHVISVNSGTSALEIALRAHDLKSGDEVVIPTNTFGATAAAVVFSGGKPVITDVARSSLTLDSNTARRAIASKTRGIIAVHIGGLICPEIKMIREICDEKDLFLIEDAAHAHGSKIDGQQAGSLGSAGCFSFYPTKVITSGEGGAITTNDEEIAKTARILRDQGKESFSSNRIVRLGYNWRMPELCAVVGIVQLRRLNEFIQRRNKIAKIYDSAIDALGVERVVTPPNQVNNYYKYTFFLPRKTSRDEFKALCKERGVSYGGEVYWPPLHLQPAFHEYIDRKTEYSVTDEWCSRMVNPPMFSQMTKEQAERVVTVTREGLSKLGG
jgi:perosamine synthetase